MYKTFVTIRSMILVFLTHNMALPLLRIIRRPEEFPYTAEQLRSFPGKTLGRELIDFLDAKDLKLLTYYARHDIKHILLGYDTTDKGEVCLQCFMLGNRHLSFPVAATVVFGVLTMPEHWGAFKQSYRRGRSTLPIDNWKWFELLDQSTASLQKKITQDA